MKTINIYLENEEHKKKSKIKGKNTWKEVLEIGLEKLKEELRGS